MGADLYIKDLPREQQYRGFEVSKEAVEVGYFRDCYNDGGLFNYLRSNTGKDYSWWTMLNNKSWFDRQKNMTVAGAKKFLTQMLEAKEIIAKRAVCELKVIDFDSPKKVPNEIPYKTLYLTPKQRKDFDEWLDLLIRFLNLAIARKSKIIYSV